MSDVHAGVESKSITFENVVSGHTSARRCWSRGKHARHRRGRVPRVHVAFVAPDRAAVKAFFDAAVPAGAEVLHGPRVWPEYHPGYYGAFVDPDGNNVEAVCHRAT
ncbi:MAG TPA: VOC family protein [Acidimicrobiales bacterium]|nr:VOC family protein [Acidimicrobiales bacterium]